MVKSLAYGACLLSLVFLATSCAGLRSIDLRDAHIVDVRTPQEFSHGSATHAINIPLGELRQRLHELRDKKYIVVFCHTGIRSTLAASVLRKNGFRHIINAGTWQRADKQIRLNNTIQ
ncbi:MAG: rhodanese-like domain-containing protein [Chitinophagales bacterium]|nr:rhodanese-like domain-containing protein [Chitinophagales bacterium]MDW8418529.1 rhodanese-like domain-containing protein [Chitinophagales bacterium]